MTKVFYSQKQNAGNERRGANMAVVKTTSASRRLDLKLVAERSLSSGRHGGIGGNRKTEHDTIKRQK